MSKESHKKRNIIIAIAVLLCAGILYGGYEFWQTTETLESTRNTLASTTIELENSKIDNENLAEVLEAEKAKNTMFENQIKEIAGTVGVLDKLSKTDKELLQKYSKVYFLNEHYVPQDLATVAPEFAHEEKRTQKIHSKVLPRLEQMMKDAKEAGKEIKVISAYRSFDDQSILKGSYTVNYGSGANRFSADQGYSEHQLGTTLDFTTPELGSNFNAFKNSEAYKWLLENAHKYGFTLSYPEGNTYYQFEPWHWRFVGTKLALRLHNENENFYDIEQRTIDNYLINIFD